MTAAKLEMTTPSDHEIQWSRVFNAPRTRVFEAITTPGFVRRWLLGPPGWVMEVCEIDLRPGGKYRYLWRRERDSKEMGMSGVYREVLAPERIVSTELFVEAWYSGEALGTVQLVERDGKTTLIQTVRYESQSARDGVLSSGWEDGVSASYARLDGIVAAPANN
jgi:uncharacterized protein YndB with AHSA1/START domain